MTDAPILYRLSEAAQLARVSVAYLRACSCPKVRLPGNGPKGRETVRIRREDLLAWIESRSTKKAS